MYSVSARSRAYKQPRGGFLPVRNLNKTVLDSPIALYPRTDETVPAGDMGMAVDYLSRFMDGATAEEAFKFSLCGAANAEMVKKGSRAKAEAMVQNIRGLDDDSIRTALKLVRYDVWFRNYSAALLVQNPDPEPSAETIENVRTMVNRSLVFFKTYGPVTKDGFDFAPGGYTDIVYCGDGDFLTKDTLWDFKVSSKAPTSYYTLQLLMYYIMGKHSGNPVFDPITHIGIFNPRLNTVYTTDMANISKDVLQTVEQDVIGFKNSAF